MDAASDRNYSIGDTLKVLLVEDHPMFREYLAILIKRDLAMSICGECDNIRDAMLIAEEARPDIAIVDLTLRGSSGLEFIKDVRSRNLPTKLLVLSMHNEELYAERAIRAGAMGYITKNEAASEVIEAIRCVMAGEIYASRRITSKLINQATKKASQTKLFGLETLADRELEVFQWVGRGKNSREIASLLGLGESTVETYRSRIKEKLQLRSAAELYLRAGEWVRENGG